MNKIRPHQVELQKLLEDYLGEYLSSNLQGKNWAVEKVIQQQVGNWYFFEADAGFFVPTDEQLRAKIRQKFRDMKKLLSRDSCVN